MSLLGCLATPRLEPGDPRPEIAVQGEGAVLAVAFAGSDVLLAVHDRQRWWSVGGPTSLGAWDLATGRRLWEVPVRRLASETHEKLPVPLAVSTDGTLVASADVAAIGWAFGVGDLTSRVFVRSVSDGSLVHSFETRWSVSSVAFGDGTATLSAAASARSLLPAWGEERTEVTEWSLEDGEVLGRYFSQSERVFTCGTPPRLGPQGDEVVLLRTHGERLLEAEVRPIRGDSTVLRSAHLAFLDAGVALSEDGTRLAVCNSGYSWGNTLEVWAIPSGDRLLHAVRGGNRPTCVALSPDGEHVAAGTLYPGGVWLFHIGRDEQLARLGDLEDTVVGKARLGTTSLAFSPDGDQLAAGTLWGEVVIWNVAELGVQ